MFFLDIDHTTVDDPRVSRINVLLNTYAELSQSGAGVHFYGYPEKRIVFTFRDGRES